MAIDDEMEQMMRQMRKHGGMHGREMMMMMQRMHRHPGRSKKSQLNSMKLMMKMMMRGGSDDEGDSDEDMDREEMIRKLEEEGDGEIDEEIFHMMHMMGGR